MSRATCRDSGQLSGHQGLGRDTQERWFEEHMSCPLSVHVFVNSTCECSPRQVPGNTAMNRGSPVFRYLTFQGGRLLSNRRVEEAPYPMLSLNKTHCPAGLTTGKRR